MNCWVTTSFDSRRSSSDGELNNKVNCWLIDAKACGHVLDAERKARSLHPCNDGMPTTCLSSLQDNAGNAWLYMLLWLPCQPLYNQGVSRWSLLVSLGFIVAFLANLSGFHLQGIEAEGFYFNAIDALDVRAPLTSLPSGYLHPAASSVIMTHIRNRLTCPCTRENLG